MELLTPAADELDNADHRVKYPKTRHFHFSNTSSDDVILGDYSGFKGEEVVVTEKMDGENTTIYRDGMHARELGHVGCGDPAGARL